MPHRRRGGFADEIRGLIIFDVTDEGDGGKYSGGITSGNVKVDDLGRCH